MSSMIKSKQKAGILTHSERLHARKIRLRWLIALSSLPLFGMVTAFGIAPANRYFAYSN
jgi:hypothetical protein